MNIEVETQRYNDRRYGKPWIAKVDFSNGVKGDFIWGEWSGAIGDDGILYLEVDVGDVIATGQKDYRKPRNSTPDFSIVQPDGSLEAVSRSDAYKHYRKGLAPANPLARIPIDELLAEVERRKQPSGDLTNKELKR